MKPSKSVAFCTLILAICCSSSRAIAADFDPNMRANEATVTDHFDLNVLSFLAGRWVSETSQEKTECSWEKPQKNSTIARTRRLVEGKISDEFAVKSSELDRSVDFSFKTNRSNSRVKASIVDYSSRMVKFEFKENPAGLKFMTYKLESPGCLKLISQKLSGGKLVSETTEFKKAI